MRQGTVGVWRSHAMRERRKRTGKEFNNELFLVMTMHEISHKRGLYKIPEEQKYKSKTKFRSWKCLISVPSHCRKDKKVLMVPNFGKSHFVEIGRPVFSAVGKLWVVSLALGTRTQRRVARSSYTTGSTTHPPTHQKTFFTSNKVLFYPQIKKIVRVVQSGCTTSSTTQPTWPLLWKILKLRLLLLGLDRGIDFKFYF